MNYQLATKKIFKGFYFDVTDWFSSNRYFNEDSFITRMRYFQITAFSILFVTSFINFLLTAEFCFFITATASIILIVVRFLIDNNKVRAAYLTMLLCINGALILLTSIEGLHSGVFLYFFPSIISFGFLADMKKDNNVLLTYGAGIGSFLIALLLAPGNPTINDTAHVAGASGFSLNIVFSFFMVVWMSHSLAKENNRKQTILVNKEIFLDTIFNSSLHAEIIVEAGNGFISSYNRHAILLFAVEEGQTLDNKPVYELFPDDHNAEFLKSLSCPHTNWKGELACIKKDGTNFPGKITVVSFEYFGRNFKKMTILDITEKNQILSELQEAKQKAEDAVYIKSQFLSHMSHELRTPLNGIIGSTNLLLQDKYKPCQKEQLDVLRYSSEHMLSLINDILDLSKLEANKIQLEQTLIEIPDLINKIVAPFVPQYEKKSVKFEVKVDPTLHSSLLADPTRINQVLTNLLSNALKFTAQGSVTMYIKAIKITSELNTLEFNVTDTGIGIAKDKKEQIFEQFSQADLKTTRKYGGTGLGLTISQQLVKLMGGELKVDSQYQKGSRFYFTISLPVHSSGVKKMYVTDENLFVDMEKLKGIRVLIAEDNPINMMIATKFLSKWGVVFEKAKNGAEAVDLFRKGGFDLILMDLEMPEMDGYGALSEIRSIDNNMPAIAFTAAVFENMKEKLNECGFNDYIQKPFRPIDLQTKLVKYSQKLAKSA
jgi:CheY-like chemotaxis protein/nitrogen-specific signal transduction histidine kinase